MGYAYAQQALIHPTTTTGTVASNLSESAATIAMLLLRSTPAMLDGLRAVARVAFRILQSELEQMMGEYTALRARYEQAEQQRASLKLSLTDAQAAAADAAVEVRAATAKVERLQQELDLTKSESVSQASSLRSQATAREERMAAQHTCRMAQLQSELDAQAAAAADTEAALAAARQQVELVTGQVGGRSTKASSFGL
jgi:chromosome segregation ATPase